MRFGTVGSGWITDAYIEGAKRSGLWTLTAVYSRDGDRARDYAAKHGAAHAFSNLEEMAASDVIDAVYLASPNAFHATHCEVFLQAGKHVLCEKPLCAQSGEVARLQALAKEHGVVFMEAIMYMHLPQRQVLREAVAALGPLSMVKLDFCQRSSKLNAYLAGELPNIFNPALDTGAWMDLGVYCVYPALDLFGLPKEWTVQMRMLKSGVDAAGVVTMEYDGFLVTLTFSKVGQAKAGSEFQSAQGTVYVDSISRLADMSRIAVDGTVTPLWGSEEKHVLMGHEAVGFHQAITSPGNETYRYGQRLSLQVSEWMEAVRKKAGLTFPSDKG